MAVRFINPFLVSPSATPITVRAWAWNNIGSSITIALTTPSSALVGDLLIAVVTKSGTTGTISWPAGWTEFEDAATSVGLAYAWKVCVSGDINTSFTITSSTSLNMVAYVVVIQGYNSASAPVDGAGSTGTSAAPNASANAAHSWGTGVNTLFLCVQAAANSGTGDFAAAPTGYSDLPFFSRGLLIGRHTSGLILDITYKVAKATTDNPPATSIGVSAGWRCNTIAVRGLV